MALFSGIEIKNILTTISIHTVLRDIITVTLFVHRFIYATFTDTNIWFKTPVYWHKTAQLFTAPVNISLYFAGSKLYVSVGQEVSRAQIIAAMGHTGVAYGTHLHFGVYVGKPYNGGYSVNPMRLWK